MSDREHPAEIRRILVALDASPQCLPLLKAAADLASRMEAELMGLFVEDIELLRMAESPYAREILYPSATEVPLTRATMEAKLRALSERTREALRNAAIHAQVQWSFQTVRGEILEELREAASHVDLLAISGIGGPLGRLRSTPSAALQIASGPAPVLLIPPEGIIRGARVAVYYDGSAGSKLGLVISAQLAAAAEDGITVLLGAENPEAIAGLKDEAARALENKGIEVRYRVAGPQDPAALRKVLQSEKPGILILGGLEPKRKQRWVETVLEENDVALLLLEGGGGGEE